jgi:hypothetical protein
VARAGEWETRRVGDKPDSSGFSPLSPPPHDLKMLEDTRVNA